MTKWYISNKETNSKTDLNAYTLNDAINEFGRLVNNNELEVSMLHTVEDTAYLVKKTYFKVYGYDNMYIVKEVEIS